MSTIRTLQLLLPQPGEDLKSWARSLTAQLQMMLPLLTEYVDSAVAGGSEAVAPIYQSDGTTEIITATGEFKLPGGTVVIDSTGLHVLDADGFAVINGPTIRIDTTHLVDAAVETAKLAADAVTAPKLAAGSVVAGKIAANAIVAGDAVIANGAIVDAQIANLNASKINAGSIAAARMEANIVSALTGKFATLSALAASLGVVQIQAGGALLAGSATGFTTGTGLFIDDTKLRLGNPSGARIEWTGTALNIYNASNQLSVSAGTVDWSYIANISVGTAHIANAAITDAKLDRASANKVQIVTADIVDASITNAKLGSASVTTLKIGDNAVTIPVIAEYPTSFYFYGTKPAGVYEEIAAEKQITLTESTSVIAVYSGDAFARTVNVTAANSAEIRLYLNGTYQYTLCSEVNNGADSSAQLYVAAHIFTLGAGTHTISVRAYTYAGSSGKYREIRLGQQRSLMLLGAKR